MDEGSAGVAKDALHNYKLDGENKIKVREHIHITTDSHFAIDHICAEVNSFVVLSWFRILYHISLFLINVT
jgi:hypothetical protein